MTASRRVRLIILLVVAFSFVGVVYAAIVYVPVTNSGFISDLSGWTLIQEGGFVEWSEGGYSDAGEALAVYGSGGVAVAWQSFINAEVSPTTYTASAWFSCTAPGTILLGYWDPEFQGNMTSCPSETWSQCSVSFTIPSEIPSFEVYVGIDNTGVCEIDNVQLSYEIETLPTPIESPTAFGFMLGNVIYVSIGFLTFFAVLAFGMWISRIKIVGGIKQRE